jgi:hypothetical protein
MESNDALHRWARAAVQRFLVRLLIALAKQHEESARELVECASRVRL